MSDNRCNKKDKLLVVSFMGSAVFLPSSQFKS